MAVVSTQMPMRTFRTRRAQLEVVESVLSPVDSDEELVELDDLSVDPHWHEVTRGSQSIHLTRLEFQLLYLLVQNADRVVSYTNLIHAAWGFTAENSAQAILKTPISRLRSKLELHPPGRLTLASVPRVGYVLSMRPA